MWEQTKGLSFGDGGAGVLRFQLIPACSATCAEAQT